MLKYIVKRLLQLVPIMLGVAFLTFGLMYLAPGDAASMKLSSQGVTISQDLLEKTRIEMGIDRPFIIQFFQWLKNFLIGDMGKSYVDNISVIEKIAKALPATALLTISSMIVTLAISIPLGIMAAVKQNKIVDYIIRSITFVGISAPNFFISLFLIYFFALRLNWISVLPQGMMMGLILPTVAQSIALSSTYIRQVRAVILEELKKDYVIGARSRGLKEWVILYRNVLPNSMITIVTLSGLSIGTLLAGTVVVENIFQWPGLGKLAMDAIIARDYPVVQGFVVLMSFIYMMVNLMTDVSYWLIDPRTYNG